MIIGVITGFGAFETGQASDGEKNLCLRVLDSVQLYDNHLLTGAAEKGSYFGLRYRQSGREQIRAHQRLPHKPRSWNGPDSE